ncbi:HET-domain-containing protein, partial [Thozetella sp. PMI_491]
MTDEERYLELYKPEKLKLTGGPSEVRLIDIQPGALSEPLSITLERHIIRSTNDYIALSYHWGDPKEARVKVPCNGQDIAITRNLHEALTYIRMPHNPVRIWADALCINQQDDQEKNVQVGRMDQIYQRASCVVVWLGLPADDSDLVFQMARTVRPRIEKIDRESYTDRQARAVDALKRRHWFNRIWVVQE